jgi:tmRNA-binding protein
MRGCKRRKLLLDKREITDISENMGERRGNKIGER